MTRVVKTTVDGRKTYSNDFKEEVLRAYHDGGHSAAELAKKYKIKAQLVWSWSKAQTKRAGKSKGADDDMPPVKKNKADGRLELWVKNERAQLLQLIGEQVLEIMHLKAKRG